jgi:phosphomannomutase
MDDLEARVREWIAGDADADTRAELKDLLACRTCDDPQACDRAQGDLEDRFGGYLTFGTAGLRGQIGGGPNRINSIVVAHASAAVARFVNRFEKRSVSANVFDGPPTTDSLSLMPTRTVVVGYDARTKSAEFAQIAADVLAGAGIRTILSNTVVPTPLLAFAVRHLNADAGVMITASHNPRGDNGYKVYLGGSHDGRQLVAPYDAEIHAYMVESIETIPTRDLRRGAPVPLDTSVVDAYVALTASLVPEPIYQPPTVYTAMHGVGSALTRRVLMTAGFDVANMLTTVSIQDAPDGDFPTLPFPNPEEDGALDDAFELGRARSAVIVLAHDPDADRLGVGIPDSSSATGYRRLTGNEIGVLLGAWAAERAAKNGEPSGTLACSIVSTPQLERVARHFGYDFAWTLSGFKWISRVPNLLYGFEEALGYLVNPNTVSDKDGISAALAVLSLASELHAEGKSIADRLAEIDEQFGTYVSGAFSIRTTRAHIAAAMRKLRTSPPTTLAGVAVDHIEDLSRTTQGDRSSGGQLPTADVLAFWLADGSRVMFRPSGTEAKLKVYLDVCEETGAVSARRVSALLRLDSLTAAVRALAS